MLKPSGLWLLLLLPCAPRIAPAQSLAVSPAKTSLIHPEEEEGIPTLWGKPFIDVSFDAFVPRGASLGPLAATQAVGVAAGLRPLKYIQLDVFGFGLIPSGMAGDGRQTYIQFSDGPRLTRHIDDQSILINTGARLALPLWRDRFLLSAGGGWAGLFVSESIDTPDPYGYDYNPLLNQCNSCRSRHGWGPTTVAEVLVFPSPARGLGFGFHIRTVQINSNGLSFRRPASPGANDRFLMVGGVFSVRFGH